MQLKWLVFVIRTSVAINYRFNYNTAKKSWLLKEPLKTSKTFLTSKTFRQLIKNEKVKD